MLNTEAYYAQLGGLIKKRREALTLTQADVASSVGVSRTSFTNMECGRQRIMVDQLQKICTTLNMPVAQLLNKVDLEPVVAPAPDLSDTPTVVEFLESVGINRKAS